MSDQTQPEAGGYTEENPPEPLGYTDAQLEESRQHLNTGNPVHPPQEDVSIHHEPVNPGQEAEPAEGRTNQPVQAQPPASDEEQVATLQQTPPEELAVDPSIEQPTQDPNVVIESDDEADE